MGGKIATPGKLHACSFRGSHAAERRAQMGKVHYRCPWIDPRRGVRGRGTPTERREEHAIGAPGASRFTWVTTARARGRAVSLTP